MKNTILFLSFLIIICASCKRNITLNEVIAKGKVS